MLQGTLFLITKTMANSNRDWDHLKYTTHCHQVQIYCTAFPTLKKIKEQSPT